MRIGYLTSCYPAISHAFLVREVEALRGLGVDVETMSIRRADASQILSQADRQAFRTTFAVVPSSVRRIVSAHARALFTRPRGYVETLALSLGMAPPGARGVLWQLFYFVEAMILWDHCRRSGVEHIHAQFADVATDVALLVAHFERPRRGRPGWSWSLAVHGPVEFYDVRLYRLAAKVRSARFVLAISFFGRSQLMAQVEEGHWAKIHVVRCGVDPSVYIPADREQDTTGDREKEMRILCVGRLVPLKGQALLIEAIAELARSGVPARLTLVGDGPKRSDLEQLARRLGVQDEVVFAGSVGQDALRGVYATTDVFCLPTFAEGLPVVLMEALAMEVPVVTSRVMGIPELVEHGANGLLTAPGRLDELVDALRTLAADPDRRRRMGEAGRRKVMSEFDVRRSAESFRDILCHSLKGLVSERGELQVDGSLAPSRGASG